MPSSRILFAALLIASPIVAHAQIPKLDGVYHCYIKKELDNDDGYSTHAFWADGRYALIFYKELSKHGGPKGPTATGSRIGRFIQNENTLATVAYSASLAELSKTKTRSNEWLYVRMNEPGSYAEVQKIIPGPKANTFQIVEDFMLSLKDNTVEPVKDPTPLYCIKSKDEMGLRRMMDRHVSLHLYGPALQSFGARQSAPPRPSPQAPGPSEHINCARAQGGPEAKYCATMAAQRIDAELNSVYKRAMGILPSAQKEALRNAQRNWIKHRDTQCEKEASAVGDAGMGSDYEIQYQTCLAGVTKKRVDELSNTVSAFPR
jgi:uncharacterized protein YecT (DUF1311 family)